MPGAPFFVPNYIPVSSTGSRSPFQSSVGGHREYWAVWGTPLAERASRVRFATNGEDAHCDDTPPPSPPRRWPRSGSPWTRAQRLAGTPWQTLLPSTPQSARPGQTPIPPQSPWVPQTPHIPQTSWAPQTPHIPQTTWSPRTPHIPQTPNTRGAAQGQVPTPQSQAIPPPQAMHLNANPDPFEPTPPAWSWVPVPALIPVQAFQWQFGTPHSSVNPWASTPTPAVATAGPFTPASLFPSRTDLLPETQQNVKEEGLLDELLYNHQLEWDVRLDPSTAKVRSALGFGTHLYTDLNTKALGDSVTEIWISFYDIKLYPLEDLWGGVIIKRENTLPAFTSKDVLQGISAYFSAAMFDNEVAYLCPTARQRRQLEDQRNARERLWHPTPADCYRRSDLLNGHCMFSKVFVKKISGNTCHLLLSIR